MFVIITKLYFACVLEIEEKKNAVCMKRKPCRPQRKTRTSWTCSHRRQETRKEKNKHSTDKKPLIVVVLVALYLALSKHGSSTNDQSTNQSPSEECWGTARRSVSQFVRRLRFFRSG